MEVELKENISSKNNPWFFMILFLALVLDIPKDFLFGENTRKLLDEGHKIKRKNWTNSFIWLVNTHESEKVLMFTDENGNQSEWLSLEENVLKEHIMSDDWQIVE